MIHEYELPGVSKTYSCFTTTDEEWTQQLPTHSRKRIRERVNLLTHRPYSFEELFPPPFSSTFSRMVNFCIKMRRRSVITCELPTQGKMQGTLRIHISLYSIHTCMYIFGETLETLERWKKIARKQVLKNLEIWATGPSKITTATPRKAIPGTAYSHAYFSEVYKGARNVIHSINTR